MPLVLADEKTERQCCPVVEFGAIFSRNATIESNRSGNFLLRFCSAITCVEADIRGALWDDDWTQVIGLTEKMQHYDASCKEHNSN
jgi:hypothetical protein